MTEVNMTEENMAEVNMTDCDSIPADFYDGFGFVEDVNLLNAERATNWVAINIMRQGLVTEDGQNLQPLIGLMRFVKHQRISSALVHQV